MTKDLGESRDQGSVGIDILKHQKKCSEARSKRRPSPPQYHRLRKGQKQSPNEAEIGQQPTCLVKPVKLTHESDGMLHGINQSPEAVNPTESPK